jgi:hypothetical protein
MNLYLDDDHSDGKLVKLLRQAGHDVQLPIDVSMSGKKDPEHLCHAIDANRVLACC